MSLLLLSEAGSSQLLWEALLDSASRVRYKLLVAAVTGEGNGTPLQYSCLENPMDRGAWWAAVHGVAKSRTRLKRLSSSSSNILEMYTFYDAVHLYRCLREGLVHTERAVRGGSL